MSDLQCAARLFVINPEGLGDVPSLTVSFGPERVAGVYAAVDVEEEALEAAQRLAEGLDVALRRCSDDLADINSGLGNIVDLHRGEAVVIVRLGDEVTPVVLLVDADGASRQPFRASTPTGGCDGAARRRSP